MTDDTLAERRHRRALSIIRRWRLLDDEFMKRCLKDNPRAVECILRIIMEKPDLLVKTVHIEDTIPNLTGRGIRMDVHAIDGDGTEYDIEVQRSDKGAGFRRARYNSSLLDLNALGKGDDPDKLPESYVIFITERDVMKRGLSRYHIDRYIREMDEFFDDGEHIIYVNGAYEGHDDMGNLMNDFRASDPSTMVLEPLRETVDRYKNNPKEVAEMCVELEKWGKEERDAGMLAGRALGLEEGRSEGENRLGRLMKLLISQGDTEDALKASSDVELRNKLYLKYGI